MFTMLWNTLKDGLRYQRNESVSMKVFFLHMREATDYVIAISSKLSNQIYNEF